MNAKNDEEKLPLPYPMTIWWQDRLLSLTDYLGDRFWEGHDESGGKIIVRIDPLDVVVELSRVEADQVTRELLQEVMSDKAVRHIKPVEEERTVCVTQNEFDVLRNLLDGIST